jgi:hypothetical protein
MISSSNALFATVCPVFGFSWSILSIAVTNSDLTIALLGLKLATFLNIHALQASVIYDCNPESLMSV